ncbi:hypothetical protein FJZ31_30255 [Candidatus Poribacteria bacterium]|nr:hypothetical protein [Candidatus Poribacteria bacterium]
MRCLHLSNKRKEMKSNINPFFFSFPSIRRFFCLSFLLSFLIFPDLSHSNTSMTSLSDAANTINILNSDESGITLELTIPELKTEVQQFDGVRYQAVSYQGCGYTSEAGNPRVPVSRILLGAPPEAICRVQVLDNLPSWEGSGVGANIRTGYRLPPVPIPHSEIRIPNSGEDLQTITGKYDESGSAYHSLASTLYPQQLAEVIYDGYIRDQRVITVELHPVQYNPNGRILKVNSRLVVKVNFDAPAAAPVLSENGKRARGQKGKGLESKVFEDFYRKKLINYDNAKNWRKRRPPSLSVPAAPSNQMKPLYKIFVEKTGVYRLTYDDLNGARGQEGKKASNPLAPLPLSSIDPKNLSLRLRGKEIPIYVHGEADGKFDEGDYIEFLGLKTDSIYTRWNVYWLYLSDSPGKRVAELDGAPDDPTGVLVSTFDAKIHFEEDRFYQVLQHVNPEDVSPDDPHAWYQARDHWFWTGIKNSSDKNEVELKFRLYDIAPTLDRPKIELLLTGGTPAQHEILTSINSIKMANAKWEMQDEMRITRYLRSQEELVNATKGYNVIRCARVDTTTEENALSYPYHIYINSFDVEYVRLLKAVNDYLLFKSPKSHDSYEVRKRRKLEYKVSGFLDPNIELFETDGYVLLAKIKNPSIRQVILTNEDRERLRVILQDKYQEEHPVQSFAEEEEQIAAPAIADFTINVPTTAYNVTFHYPDTHDAQFISVSQAGLLKPARIVDCRLSIDDWKFFSIDNQQSSIINPLKDTSNGADYIIITHPIFMESAQRLGDWRRTLKGGNYRVKVVDVTDIYDEFNYGMVSPQAIKDFLEFAYFNWQQPAVSYVVLFGDGTFDFKGIDKKTYPEPPELNGYIPPHYVWTTYGDTSTDHWYATVSGIDVLPDFFLGRLTVETQDEAAAVVDKIVKYDDSRPNGSWRRRIISIADDDATNSGDFIFKKSLDEVSQNNTLLGFETTKIFLEDVMEQVNANPTQYGNMLPGQVTRQIITEELSKGAVIAQYAGHGGRVVWAHEIIFDNYAVQRLQETDKLPFLLVFSCYNGYFDKPGTPSMAEALLRLPKSGIIGMLSATRLTYGSGNDALNKIIFDDIFKRNMRGLGEIAFDSKLEVLITDGYGQFEVMQQYTLFGDPATKIAMAEYEITPAIQTPTVKLGGVLRIAPGKILRSTYDEKLGRKQYLPVSDFSGKLKVTAKFPGGRGEVISGTGEKGEVSMEEEVLEVNIEKSVSLGEYPEIELKVPTNAQSGKGVVEYYAENETEIAVGGAVFSVEIPRIVDIIEEIVGEAPNFRIAAKVADDLYEAGIKEVTLQWRNPADGEWIETKMNPDSKLGAGWYATLPLLPSVNEGELSPSGNSSYDGSGIRYQVIVVDVDNNRAESEQRQFFPLAIPNFKVVSTLQNEPLIYYTIETSEVSRTSEVYGYIKVEIENTEDVDIKEDVEVYFYDGNPDQNEDDIVDEEAKPLGHVTVTPDKWVKGQEGKRARGQEGKEKEGGSEPRAFQLAPLNINRIAVAEVKYTLSTGRHAIFAWIDPEFEQKSQNRIGKIKEQKETDNKVSQVIEVNEYFILPGGVPTSARSLDDVMRLTIPPKSVDNVAVLKVATVKPESVPQAINQPKTTNVMLPEEKNAAAYQAILSTRSPGTSATRELLTPATVELKFDLDALREKIKGEIGLGDISFASLDEAQKASIEQAIEEESKNQFAIYLFEQLSQKWVRLESKTVVNSNGELSRQAQPANIRTQNIGTGTISNVKVDNEKTDEGIWTLMFIADNRYHLFFSDLSSKLQEIAHSVDIFQLEPFQEPDKGIGITVIRGDKLFEFGDVLRFETIASTSQERRWMTVSYAKDSNDGDGVIQYLTADENTPVDKWVIFFLDSTHFSLYGKQAGLAEDRGQPLMGTVGEEFFDPNSKLRFNIIAGATPFAPGDRFVFETREVGKILANTQHPGIFKIMRGADTIPPDIQFSIGHQNFVDGAPVSSNPQLSALIADDNGVDLFVRKPELSSSYNDGNFTPVLESEYRLDIQPGSNQAVLNYSPTLQEGKYELQLLAYDTDGNMSKESTTFHVHKTLQLLDVMNYPNPFLREGTHITFEITSEVDEVEVKIYTISGRLIRALQPDEHIGFIMAYWDGRDEDGDEVANGVYYGKVTVKKEGQKKTEIVKMMKLR